MGTDLTVAEDLDLHFPAIDSLGDGFVVAGRRCTMPSGRPAATVADLEREIPHNARRIAADGTTLGTFHAGDDIQYLLTGPDGTIWTGYGDEASICAARPGPPGPGPDRRTMSHPVLVRWTSAGEPTWYATEDSAAPHSIFDCYALNVGARRTWACTYTGFPLLEIDQQGIGCVRRTPARSPAGVLVQDDQIAFLSSDHRSLTYGRITGGPVEVTGNGPVLGPDRGRVPGVVCRDNRLYLPSGDRGAWYRLEF